MKRHLIIGGSHPTAVGNSLRYAAVSASIPHEWMDYDEITRASRLRTAFCWRVLNKRPPNLGRFNEKVSEICDRKKCDSIICAGNLFLTSDTLMRLSRQGVFTSVWLTDDPWNPIRKTKRFLESLSFYNAIFTPRKANQAQLNALLPERVYYLPFGYDPRYFTMISPREIIHDVFFAGGADQERATLMGYLLRAGLNVGLYGAYWNRYPETRGMSAGYAAPEQLSTLIASSRVSLCLVRRSNRDGHSMRTFEIGATGASMLAEDTDEHREIFGEEGLATLYFSGMDDMVEKCRWMIEHEDEARMMGDRLARKVTSGGNTYEDRLIKILSIAEEHGR